jgi:hypothetical protein
LLAHELIVVNKKDVRHETAVLAIGVSNGKLLRSHKITIPDSTDFSLHPKVGYSRTNLREFTQ